MCSAFLWFGNEIEIGLPDVSISDGEFVWGSAPLLRDVYMVSKSPRPAPSCHWTHLLILDAGTREPRMQRLVARSIARLSDMTQKRMPTMKIVSGGKKRRTTRNSLRLK
jgi:hypothetical protein